MEEKEILNEVNGSGKDKVRRILMYIGWGLSAVLLVSGIMLISRVMKLNVLTTPYMVILIASVIVVTGVIAFLQKWMVSGIITKIIAIAMSVIMVMSCAPQQKKPVYPETAKVDTVDVYFGTQVPDPFRWLENDTSAATTACVEAQNKVTNEYLSQIPFQENLLKRLTELADYEKISAPVKKHGKY